MNHCLPGANMPFPIDEIFVKKTEAKVRAAFPESYRTKMMGENGGEIVIGEDTWFLYPILDETDKKRASRTGNDIVHETESAKKWRGFPPNAISIAHNGEGDLLVFLIDAGAGKMGEAVFVWNHDNGSLETLSTSFGSLLEE
jgi:hypothetical protein